MVEIFKTNIESKQTAVDIINSLQFAFPNYKMNIDLEDCDKILRVESTTIEVEAIQIHLEQLKVDIFLID